MRTTIAIIALVAAALTACGKADAPDVSKYITIEASVGDLTTRATATAFETGDAVSIYAWTGSAAVVGTPLVVDNAINTKTVSAWIATPQMLWNGLTTPHFFLGVYPQKAITNFTADSYATATDVLVATVLDAGRTADQGAVPMVFDHVMSKLVVNLTFRSQFDGTPTVTAVQTTAQSASTVDYLAKAATGSGAAAAVTLTATTANTAYATVLPPQDITTIVITIEGTDYTYTHAGAFTLAAGKIQTLNLIVGRDTIELGTIAITDWTAGTIGGGDAL